MPELLDLQPSPSPDIVSDTEEEGLEQYTWPNGPEPEEVSQSMDTTSLSTTEPTMETPERIGFGKVGLGFMETPEVGNVPAIHGELDGKKCRVLLDSGCGTYAISRSFAESNGIEIVPTPPIPLELAEDTEDERIIRSQTNPLRIQLGAMEAHKSFHVLDRGCHDVIFGSPFFRSYTPQFDWETHHVKIAGENHVMVSPTKTTPPVTVAVVSRAKLKSIIRHDDADAIYVGLLKPTTDNDDSSDDNPPAWITKEYSNVFTEGLPAELPPSRAVDHEIPILPDLAPPFRAIFRLSQSELDILKETIDKLLKEGKINPSTSPYGAPVLFVKKKDGSLRMCIDYRALNSQTVKNCYALPRVDELLDRLYKATIFSKIDLTSGYYQIMIAPHDRYKTAFRTQYGHFEFNVMPFGLTNAPATFQTLMNDVFRDLLDVCVIVYLDDILIYSNNVEDHERHVRMVLERLRKHKLYGKLSKSTFFTTEIEYLGQIVSPGEIRPNPSLVKAIQQFPRPESIKSLQAFLGLVNYYRKFIHDYSTLVVPLTDVLKSQTSNRPIEWTPPMTTSFEMAKQKLSEEPCLKIADPNGEFEVTTDASEDAKAVGAVLTQDGHPIAFESKKLDKHQVNYSVHDKEMRAIMHALDRWRPFLLGKPFKVYTDHRSLVYFKTQANLNARQLRWQEKAADYDMEILYKPGKENHVADALSWIRINILCPIPQKRLQSEIWRHYRTDNSIFPLYKTIQDGRESERFKIEKQLLYYRNDETSDWRLCLPNCQIRDDIIHDNHDAKIAGHPGIIKTYSNIACAYYWPGMAKDIKQHVQECDACQRTKKSNQAPPGLLQPMPIPATPWASVAMDFLGPVPRSTILTKKWMTNDMAERR
jgi:Reverse transcriptase (RNA-dependent DNA polymerase)/RNase H-like domain found in reverse transcriptase/Integrase zinc binding domain/Aspartyl protease